MFCKYCGNPIDDDSIYCRYCGKEQLNLTLSRIESVNRNVVSNSNQEEKRKHDSLNDEFDLFFPIKVRQYRLLGIIIIIVVFVGSLLAYYEAVDIEEIYGGSFILVIARFIFSYKVSSSVKELNRDSLIWWIFTFLLTGPALVAFGSLNKKLLPSNFNNYSDSGKAEFLNKYAYRIANKLDQYNKAEFIINRAIEFDKNFHPAFDTRAYIKYFKKEYEPALEDVNHAIEMCNTEGKYFYHKGHILRRLDDIEQACLAFNKSKELGYSLANEAILTHCQ